MEGQANLLSFEKARYFARTLGLKSYLEWVRYLKNEFPSLPVKPDSIPNKPNLVYRSKGWINWEDWLSIADLFTGIVPIEDQSQQNVPYLRISTPIQIEESGRLEVQVDNIIDSILLEDLKNRGLLSERAYNVCLNNNIENTESLIKFFSTGRKFRSFRNCGVNTERELNDFTKHLIEDNVGIYLLQRATPNDIEEKDQLPLNHLDQIVLTEFLDWSLTVISGKYSLSIRAENILRSVGLITAKTIVEHFESFGNFRMLRNCGSKTNDELIEMARHLKVDSTLHPTQKLSTLDMSPTGDTDHLTKLIENQVLLSEIVRLFQYLNKNFHFNSNQKDIDILISECKSTDLKFFKLLQIILKSYLSPRDFKILQARHFSNLTPLPTLSALGEMFDITRERVRQIEERKYIHVLGKIRRLLVINKFLIKYVNRKYFFSYPISAIQNDVFKFIRLDEDVDFNNGFLTIILSQLNDCEYINYQENYLLVKIDKKQFDFLKFAKEVENKMTEKISKEYTLDLELLIKKHYKKANNSLVQEIKPFIKNVLAEIFHLFVESDDTIRFKKNDYKILPEFIEDILLQQGQPLHVNEIAEILNERYPGIVKEPNSLKRLIYGNSNILHVGRNSTFAHKSLEKINSKFKAGTIRDIVYEFLKEADRKVHIKEIVKYVQKYRQTNERNISTNLKMDASRRFKVLPNNYYEISS